MRLTGNEDVPHQECTSSPGMGMCLAGNGDVTHWECTFSPGMHILTWNAHSLYRVCYRVSSVDKFSPKHLVEHIFHIKSVTPRVLTKCSNEQKIEIIGRILSRSESKCSRNQEICSD